MKKELFGEKIRIRRKSLGLSQEALAKRIGYTSRSSINKIELGINDIPYTKLSVIANALETDINYFMSSDDIEIAQLNKIISELPKEKLTILLEYAKILNSEDDAKLQCIPYRTQRYN
ncbi:MAG: helix-turn-helix transcriptional regulator [Ruminococcaceae bacterium]|nr:helix-turn-helix transcriptional regulator [Oscillospiraceae bacterium]